MRLTIIFLLFALSLPAQLRPAAKKPVVHTNADQLAMTCAEILQMSSSDWVTKFTGEKGMDQPTTIRAVVAYGKCYDARADKLATALARAGKGPTASAKTNFQSMEKALKDFTAKALTSQPPADAVKTAYAALYEKQFRYEFYESYEPKPATNTGPARRPVGAAQQSIAGTNANAPTATTAPGDAAGTNNARGAANPSGPLADLQNPPPLPDMKTNDVDPVTQAKNHFGELLGDLPDDQMHQLHAAFGEILGPNAATSHMQLLVYRYAIFLLEQPGDKPFSAPPF
jgi:hypothetical protein